MSDAAKRLTVFVSILLLFAGFYTVFVPFIAFEPFASLTSLVLPAATFVGVMFYLLRTKHPETDRSLLAEGLKRRSLISRVIVVFGLVTIIPGVGWALGGVIKWPAILWAQYAGDTTSATFQLLEEQRHGKRIRNRVYLSVRDLNGNNFTFPYSAARWALSKREATTTSVCISGKRTILGEYVSEACPGDQCPC